MATWDQGSNSGSFLAGIGLNNSNAPQASDAYATLNLIRQNNEIQRSGANNMGLLALQGLSDTYQAYNQAKAAERQKEFQDAYGKAYAAGDRNAIRQLAAVYPDQVEAVRNGMKFVDEDQRETVGNLAAGARLAASSPETMGSWLRNNASDLQRVGLDPTEVAQTYQQNPQGFGEFADHLGIAALGPDKYFDVQDKIQGRQIQRDTLAETVRSNQAGESLTARGQDIQVRGQNISAQNAQLSANGATSDMKNFSAYSRLLNTDPEAAALFAQVAGINTGAGNGSRQVQLADGRTVTINGKLHGAGANAFYEAKDNDGNTIRVPPAAIAATATSAANAQNYAMKKDIDLIGNAPIDNLDFITGVTGSTGSPAIGADVSSRIRGGDERKIYNAAQRIQGRMQNQGIAAARDMGATGINTVTEAKMYFQGMPQIDFSSPDSLQQSIRDIKTYTDNYNQQYNVNVGSNRQPASNPATPQAPSGVHTSKSGIQFTVK